jgi:hypothetical protein
MTLVAGIPYEKTWIESVRTLLLCRCAKVLFQTVQQILHPLCGGVYQHRLHEVAGSGDIFHQNDAIAQSLHVHSRVIRNAAGMT